MYNIPEVNSLVNVEDLANLNNALRKSANAGYQTPAGTSGGDAGSLSPSSLSPSRTPLPLPPTP